MRRTFCGGHAKHNSSLRCCGRRGSASPLAVNAPAPGRAGARHLKETCTAETPRTQRGFRLSLRARCASAVRVRNVSSDSLAKAARLSDGFLQYAISPHNRLTTKLTGLRWRECSICEMFFNWSTDDYPPAQ